MKTLFSIFILLTLSGHKLKSELMTLSFPEGKWIMCKNVCDGLTVSRNVCVEFNFMENGNGILKKAGEQSIFNWIMHDETIEFTFKTEFDKQAFISNDTIFIFHAFKKENDEILLTSEDLKCQYFLIESSKQ